MTPLDLAASAALARADIQAILRGEGADPWSDIDIIRAAALLRMGRPAKVVENLPPALVLPSDGERGGRMGTPQERIAACVLTAWRVVSLACGHPLPGPHDVNGEP